MKYAVQQIEFILDFLAAPVEFKDMSKNVTLEEIPKAFCDEMHLE